jgi:hypothetical protein
MMGISIKRIRTKGHLTLAEKEPLIIVICSIDALTEDYSVELYAAFLEAMNE